MAIAGATTSFHGFEPFAECSAQSPATLAGVPDASHPSREVPALPGLAPRVPRARRRAPCAPRVPRARPASRALVPASPDAAAYMSRDAEAGAVSRKSSVRSSEPKCTTANPPPARFPAVGYATASAKAVVTAASTAFPPRWSISTPAFVASAQSLVTAPCGLGAACARIAYVHPDGTLGAAGVALGAADATLGTGAAPFAATFGVGAPGGLHDRRTSAARGPRIRAFMARPFTTSARPTGNPAEIIGSPLRAAPAGARRQPTST